MLRSVKKLLEGKPRASDGEIGRVNDFYFDDQNWAVRYLVDNTGSWMVEEGIEVANPIRFTKRT